MPQKWIVTRNVVGEEKLAVLERPLVRDGRDRRAPERLAAGDRDDRPIAAIQHSRWTEAFTHVLHGFLFFWLLSWLLPRRSQAGQFTLAILLEALWEVFERQNSASVTFGYAVLVQGLAGSRCQL